MFSPSDVRYFKMAVGVDSIGRETDNDITARCPVCGDSHKSKNKKRLHLYNKNQLTLVNCFNGDCPVQNKTIYSFLRDHFPQFFPQYKRDNFANNLSSIGEDAFVNIEQNVENIAHHDLENFFIPIENSKGIDYLTNRGIKYTNKFGKWYFSETDLQIGETLYKISNAIIVPLYHKSRMYGFYSRNVDKKVFYTYNPEQNIGYKVWNWFNIDKTKPVYIFEGIFDAISSGLDNIISLMGAKLPQERLNELSHPIFVLDNDKTGIYNSIQYAKMGHSVFVPPDENFKDLNELLINDPFIDMTKLIHDNLYSGISAVVRLKSKL